MQFVDQLLTGLSLGALYALIAVGYTVVYGIVQLINFAHGEVYMVGAMTGYFLGDELTDSTAGRWTGAALGAGVGTRGLGMRSRFGQTLGKPFSHAALGSMAGSALDCSLRFLGPLARLSVS